MRNTRVERIIYFIQNFKNYSHNYQFNAKRDHKIYKNKWVFILFFFLLCITFNFCFCRFGTHPSFGPIVKRSLRINNTSYVGKLLNIFSNYFCLHFAGLINVTSVKKLHYLE